MKSVNRPLKTPCWPQQIVASTNCDRYPLMALFGGHKVSVSSGFAAVEETFRNFTDSFENASSKKGH